MNAGTCNKFSLAVFYLACAIGLIGAFFGLDSSSFWIDELFTAWVVKGDDGLSGVLTRALTDLHPPIYMSPFIFFHRYSAFRTRHYVSLVQSVPVRQ
jgi:hypothetical protein